MNQLYFSFSQMAKILAVSQDFTSNDDTYQSCLNIMDAIEVFQQFKNKRAVGICYHNLGCLTAKLSKEEYKSALNYVWAAIEIQEELADESDKSPLEQQIKDRFVLACRYYTGGAIVHNYLMSLDWAWSSEAATISQLKLIEEAVREADIFFDLSIEVLVGDSPQNNYNLEDSMEELGINSNSGKNSRDRHGYFDFQIY